MPEVGSAFVASFLSAALGTTLSPAQAKVMADDIVAGFTTRQPFDIHTFRQYGHDHQIYSFWVDSLRTPFSYAVELDFSTLTDTSIRGILLGTQPFALPDGPPWRVALTKESHGLIHIKLDL